MSSLSDGWAVKKLIDVCEKVFAGGDKPKNVSKFKTEQYSIPIYANGEKNKGLYGYTDVAKVFQPCLTVSARGTIGYAEIRNEPFTPIVRLISLIPNPEIIDIKFLHYKLKAINFINSGSSIPQLTVPMVKKYDIPFPLLLSEQQRIVTLLDKAFKAIDKAKENAEKNLKNAKEIFESYLQRVFENKGEGWEEKRLGDVCKIIGGGTPSKKRDEFYNGNILWATVRDMKAQIIETTEHKITESAVNNSSTNIIKKGNVVIATRVGLGKVCFLNYDTAINQDLKGVIPKNKEVLIVEYLFRWFKSISNKIIQEGTGATVQGVKLTFINSLTIFIPPTLAQQLIVKNINLLELETKQLEKIYQQKIYDCDELKKSILQKAFNGELV